MNIGKEEPAIVIEPADEPVTRPAEEPRPVPERVEAPAKS
jgi:hypothetical protein